MTLPTATGCEVRRGIFIGWAKYNTNTKRIDGVLGKQYNAADFCHIFMHTALTSAPPAPKARQRPVLAALETAEVSARQEREAELQRKVEEIMAALQSAVKQQKFGTLSIVRRKILRLSNVRSPENRHTTILASYPDTAPDYLSAHFRGRRNVEAPGKTSWIRCLDSQRTNRPSAYTVERETGTRFSITAEQLRAQFFEGTNGDTQMIHIRDEVRKTVIEALEQGMDVFVGRPKKRSNGAGANNPGA